MKEGDILGVVKIYSEPYYILCSGVNTATTEDVHPCQSGYCLLFVCLSV